MSEKKKSWLDISEMAVARKQEELQEQWAIRQFRASLAREDRDKVDYVIDRVEGIKAEHLKEIIERGYSMDQLIMATEGARKDEAEQVEVTIRDENGNDIALTVSPEQYERINKMSTEQVKVLAKTLRQRAAAKEREKRKQDREKQQREAKMSRREKEEANNDGWHISKRNNRDRSPSAVINRSKQTRLVKSRAQSGHTCDLPACREPIEPGETYLRKEDLPLQPGRFPQAAKFHAGCLVNNPSFTGALRLLEMNDVEVRQPREFRLPGTPEERLNAAQRSWASSRDEFVEAVREAEMNVRPQRINAEFEITQSEPTGSLEPIVFHTADSVKSARDLMFEQQIKMMRQSRPDSV